MREKQYCAFCGNPLELREAEGRVRPFCPLCEIPIYENPVPASALVVVDGEGRILLVKRSVDPKKGMWCLPGGFMELGESPEEGALRELCEETRLSGRIGELLGVTASHSQEHHTVLLMGYLIREYSGEPFAGDDAEEAAFFAPESLPELAFDSHREFVRIYLAGYRADPCG
ncbi:MAG: NUDIX domain-containing protein [Proteobacteria bacterium]|nr:NUDIX domain-containing protein [Pseudomonadota bacterium]